MNTTIGKAINQRKGKIDHLLFIANLRQSFFKYFAGITQFCVWPIIYIFFHLFFNLKIKGKENLENIASPFIIISNHISFYDSFVFRLIWGFYTLKLPLRFMAVRKFKYFFLNVLSSLYIIDLIYLLFGVFVIEPGKGIENNLIEATEIIRHGGNIVMFPEGKIVEDKSVGTFKLGAAVLLKRTRVQVVPISLSIRKKSGSLRKEFLVNIGAIRKIDHTLTDKELTNYLHKKVSDLYKYN